MQVIFSLFYSTFKFRISYRDSTVDRFEPTKPVQVLDYETGSVLGNETHGT